MKKSNLGFTLLETLIVSTFIASTLIYLFVQISNIKTSYDITFKYDTVPGLYGAQNIVNYLTDNTYDELITNLNNSTLHYVDITNGSLLLNGSDLYYKDLVKKINAKLIIFIKEDTHEIISSLDDITTFDEELKKYIRKIDTQEAEGLYRVVVEYNDNTFSSVKLGTAKEYNEYKVGDKVTVAGVNWYVIEDSDTTLSNVKLLKETNIDNNLYKFDSATSTYSNSSIKGLVDTYVNGLGLGTELRKARLIEASEITRIAGLNWDDVKTTNTTILTTPAWIFSTNYWTQTKYSDTQVWRIYTNGSINGNTVDYSPGYGIRPVIEVKKSAIG